MSKNREDFSEFLELVDWFRSGIDETVGHITRETTLFVTPVIDPTEERIKRVHEMLDQWFV